jgi:hypothetical protein
MALDKERIKESLTESDIKLILKDLGSNDPQFDRQGNLMFQTVCHSGSKHKLYYYDESKMFHCYTACGQNMDIYELVIKVKKEQGKQFSFYQSIQYVAGLTNKHYTANTTLSNADGNLISDWDWINRLKKKAKIEVDLPVYDNRVLDVLIRKPHEEWLEDGISIESMRKFEIGYYQRENRIAIPHFDIQGRFIGLRGRALNQEDLDNGRKYMPLVIQNKLYNHPTLFNLYGLHKTKEAISRIKKCAIFEGEKSVLKCEDFYGEDNFSVAACNSTISNYHRDLLLSLGIEEVIICYDRQFNEPDSQEAYIYAEKLLKLARKFAPYVKTQIVWDEMMLTGYKEAPCDRGQDILEQLMKSKYEIKTLKEVM